MKIQYREFEGATMIVMEGGGGVGDENHSQKIKPTFSIFWRNFPQPLPLPLIAIIVGSLMGDENHAEKIKNVALIFLATIFITHPPPSSSQS